MKKIYMVGIGGIGMSALAQLLADQGNHVSGSDREASPTTELLAAKDIQVTIGQKAENVPADTELLIYTEAAWDDNPERIRAKELGILERSYFEALGDVSEGKRTIAVAGTHGKTTTTSMLAKVLRDAGAAPSAVVGSIVKDFGSNYLAGTSDWLVVEACEYKRDFLTLSPEILVVTNIEFDHTDYYKDLADVQSAFRTLMEKSKVVVTDATHPNIAPLLAGLSATVIDYTKEAYYETKLPGEFNLMNARAAVAAAKVAMPEIQETVVHESLASFEGTWRRFEFKGTTKKGAEVYDDYAHHPTAVRKTLAELRKRAKGRIYVAFHPHLFSRTKDLLTDFSTAFTDADRVIIAPIYAAREVGDGSITSVLLAERIEKNGTDAKAGDFLEIRRYLETEPTKGDIIMTMGAGDIYKVADQLVA
ncbi:MAG: UDP-N-acetylmuramate--L-alanine ligase [Candidatus Pacebacteria bacterium]|nr:UDP-N-acetylmuramate--L-alanine ligase [Candidatus Paceibacterota bacterium]